MNSLHFRQNICAVKLSLRKREKSTNSVKKYSYFYKKKTFALMHLTSFRVPVAVCTPLFENCLIKFTHKIVIYVPLQKENFQTKYVMKSLPLFWLLFRTDESVFPMRLISIEWEIVIFEVRGREKWEFGLKQIVWPLQQKCQYQTVNIFFHYLTNRF